MAAPGPLRRINLATIGYDELQVIAKLEQKPVMKEPSEEERLNLAEVLIQSHPRKYFYDEDELKNHIPTTGRRTANDDEESGDDEYDYNDGFLVKDEDYDSEADEEYRPSKESEDEAAETSDEDDDTKEAEEAEAQEDAKRLRPKRPRTTNDEKKESQDGGVNKKAKTG